MAQREDLAEKCFHGIKSSIVPGKRTQHGRPPKAMGKEVRAQGVTAAAQTAKLMRLQSKTEFLQGKVQLLEDRVTERDAQLVSARCTTQRADELLKERDS